MAGLDPGDGRGIEDARGVVDGLVLDRVRERRSGGQDEGGHEAQGRDGGGERQADGAHGGMLRGARRPSVAGWRARIRRTSSAACS